MPSRSYVICTTPRSGSTMLADMLLRTDLAGRPLEYTISSLRDTILMMRQVGARSEREMIRRTLIAGTTDNGIFGIKLHAMHTAFLVRVASQCSGRDFSSLHEAMGAVFPDTRYVFLTREDKVAQAVSYYRAIMTGEWWRYPGDTAPPLDTHTQFDHYGIKKCLGLLEASDRYWERYFAAHGIEPLRLSYDDLLQDPSGAVRRVFALLEVPFNNPVPPPHTLKIADERSKAWAEEFRRREAADPLPFDGAEPLWAPL